MARNPKLSDPLLFNDGVIETDAQWLAYLAQERADMLKVMPRWAVDAFQDPKSVKYVMATCRRLGKSTWSLIFALYRLTRLPFVNHMVAVKYAARIKVTIMAQVENALKIMKDNLLLGETEEENTKTFLKMIDTLKLTDLTWAGRRIYFTSLEKPSNALGAQALTFTASSQPCVFNMLIIDELMYQDDEKSISYEDQITAIESIIGSLSRAVVNKFLHLNALYLFNSWDSEHPLYLGEVERLIPLMPDRYAEESFKARALENTIRLLDAEGDGYIVRDEVKEFESDKGLLVSSTKVVVASYLAIPKERSILNDAVVRARFEALLSETDKTADQIAKDKSQWDVEFGGLPGIETSDEKRFYASDFRYADIRRLGIIDQSPTESVTLRRLLVGMDVGHSDASALFMGILVEIAAKDAPTRLAVVPIKTSLWYGNENRRAAQGKFAIRNQKESIDFVIDEVNSVRKVIGGDVLANAQVVWCDSRAVDFIEAFNRESKALGKDVFMAKYDGRGWGLDTRYTAVKLGLTNGGIRFPSREDEKKYRLVTIPGRENPFVLLDNYYLETAFKECKRDDKADKRDERPKRNFYYVDVINSFEIAMADNRHVLQG